MAGQRFYADSAAPFAFANGATGYAPGGTFDCLGPFAKVTHCPIYGTDDGTGQPIRRTAYATGYADTFFSVPARVQLAGKTVRGYLTVSDGPEGREIEFRPHQAQGEDS